MVSTGIEKPVYVLGEELITLSLETFYTTVIHIKVLSDPRDLHGLAIPASI